MRVESIVIVLMVAVLSLLSQYFKKSESPTRKIQAHDLVKMGYIGFLFIAVCFFSFSFYVTVSTETWGLAVVFFLCDMIAVWVLWSEFKDSDQKSLLATELSFLFMVGFLGLWPLLAQWISERGEGWQQALMDEVWRALGGRAR